ncbi:PF04412 family protein [Bordetella bronchiseptica MBORD681]|uniref:aconitase X n=1 Tax=Bordetella bronchiseptica TaxID=518 RepID=UPI000460F7EE|nr:aconitase X catalytic domain-containing protein [Bordetella bronchiseptica]KDD00576.1 PF04412 family protein [Bordetella bronchiseptica MBORD698]KDD06394.1 PF04412 family protein [Bordetella bronchiseptica MBORD681]
MILTDEQQGLLNGDAGDVVAKYFTWLVEWGRLMGAQRLVKVDSVHTSGITAQGRVAGAVSPEARKKTLEQVIEFTSVRMRAPTATHVARVCVEDDKGGGLSAEDQAFQKLVIDRARDAGIQLTWTCAPYIAGILPSKNQICAWTESSAVVYINAMVGARSTRNGTESAIAAAMSGWFPEFGVLLEENRQADLIVEVEAAPSEELCDWGFLGYFAGEVSGLRTPVLDQLRAPSLEEAKQLSAAVATGGGCTMFHIAGVTPEAPTLDAVARRPLERIRYTAADRARIAAKLNTLTSERIDYVVLGCPHATLHEIQVIASQLEGRRVCPSVRLEVWTAWAVRAVAQRMGLVDVIERAGGKVLTDSCPSITRSGHGRRMVTNAVKQGNYLQGMTGHEVAVGKLTDVVSAALTGTWQGL